jgi:hypothetical protein
MVIARRAVSRATARGAFGDGHDAPPPPPPPFLSFLSYGSA